MNDTHGIVIILPEFNRGRWQVNLTDHCTVWGKRQFHDARQALAYVWQLEACGHRVLFASALRDLRDDALAAAA